MSTIKEIEAGWRQKGVWFSWSGNKIMTRRRQYFLLSVGTISIGLFLYRVVADKDWDHPVTMATFIITSVVWGMSNLMLFLDADNHRQLLSRKMAQALKALEENGIDLDD